MYICVSECVRIHILERTSNYSCVCVCSCACMCACMCVVCAAHICMCVYVRVRVRVRVCVLCVLRTHCRALTLSFTFCKWECVRLSAHIQLFFFHLMSKLLLHSYSFSCICYCISIYRTFFVHMCVQICICI